MREQFEIQGENQHVLARVVDWQGGSFEVYAPDQTIGRRDKTIVVRVICAGPGNVSRGTLNPCRLFPGDLALVNLYHRSHELVLGGHNCSTFNWENIMARISVNESEKAIELSPLQGYIVCKTNEARAQYVMMGESKIINPSGDAQLSGGGSFDPRTGKRVEQIKVACEEVVQVGPGAVIDGLWQEPRCKPGEMVLYDTSVTPVKFMAGGQSLTLIHWRAVMFTFRNAKATAPSPG